MKFIINIVLVSADIRHRLALSIIVYALDSSHFVAHIRVDKENNLFQAI